MTLTYREKFNKKYNNSKDVSNSKSDIAKLTGIPLKFINDVYDRGIGAYKSNPESVRTKAGKKDAKAPLSKKMSKEQWAISRVYAFVMKRIEGKLNHDLDIDKEIKKK